MTIMLLATGMWMFTLHTTLSIGGVLEYYTPKTFFGLLETVSPHLFAMGVLVFVLTHFFAIIKEIEQKKYMWFSLWLFIFMILTNISGFFIGQESDFFALLKLISTLGFVLYSMWAMLKVYKLF